VCELGEEWEEKQRETEEVSSGCASTWALMEMMAPLRPTLLPARAEKGKPAARWLPWWCGAATKEAIAIAILQER